MNTTHTFLLITLLLLISISLSGQDKIIEKPQTESTNTKHLFINKLEIKDSETILYCDAYHLPNYWVKIESATHLKGKSGKIYKLVRSEGFELDKEVYMPESGTMPFTLHFEPLDKTDNSFDLIEGDSHIKGIKTYREKSDSPIQCLIKGNIIDRPHSNLLYLTKKDGDIRIEKTVIPIKNGTFEYELNCNDIEAYSLTFEDEWLDGGWRPVDFFAENGTIEMTLYPMDRHSENIISGDLLCKRKDFLEKQKTVREKLYSNTQIIEDFRNSDNQEYSQNLKSILKQPIINSSSNNTDNTDLLHTKMSKLRDEDRYLNDEAKALLAKARESEDEDERRELFGRFGALQKAGKEMSPEAESLSRQIAEIESMISDWDIQYTSDNISLEAYDRLVTYTKRSINSHFPDPYTNGKTSRYIQLFNTIYSKKYPDHAYSKYMQLIIDNYLSIKVGGKYIDLTSPDFEGNPVTLSDKINGKVALIDLWASWCGPCRRLSISMIPVYEEYKDKGFTIVGIAREEKAENAVSAAKKDKYPWLNLIELKDEGQIWSKYGVGNAGGSTFLVDKDGTILALHPTADEVRKILEEKLK